MTAKVLGTGQVRARGATRRAAWLAWLAPLLVPLMYTRYLVTSYVLLCTYSYRKVLEVPQVPPPALMVDANGASRVSDHRRDPQRNRRSGDQGDQGDQGKRQLQSAPQPCRPRRLILDSSSSSSPSPAPAPSTCRRDVEPLACLVGHRGTATRSRSCWCAAGGIINNAWPDVPEQVASSLDSGLYSFTS